MKVLIINQAEVYELLPMAECMGVMAEVLSALARDEALNPLRQALQLPDQRGILGIMPGYVGNINSFGLKIVSIFHHNKGTEHDSHQGAVLLFDAEHGSLKAILDGSAITAIRTAAVSGVATRLLSRDDATELAVIGSGVQAHSHVSAMLEARPLQRVRVFSPDADHAASFVARIRESRGIDSVVAESVSEAVAGADIVCTTTSSSEPILLAPWLAPGTHINAVGSSVPFARELDSQAVLRSRLFVDRRESTVNEAGDFLNPKREGLIDDSHIRGEIGEILIGKVKGRQSENEITLFKSLGLAIEDVASAHVVYEKAVTRGLGTWVDFGGDRRLEL